MFAPLSFELFYPPLGSRVRSMDLRPATPGIGDPADTWAAAVQLDNGREFIAACYYSSDEIVGCDVIDETRLPSQ